MTYVNNPRLQGVRTIYEFGATTKRRQAVPVNWDIVTYGASEDNPWPEVFNKPGGSQVEVAWRKIAMAFVQKGVELPKGRYLLKAKVTRNTSGGSGAHTDLGWGFVVEHGGKEYGYAGEKGVFSRRSDSGEVLEVIEAETPVNVDLSFFIDTTFATVDGSILISLIDIEKVADDFGTPSLRLRGDSNPPPPPVEPPPNPDPGQVPVSIANLTSPNGLHKATVILSDAGQIVVTPQLIALPPFDSTKVISLLNEAIAEIAS